MFNNNYSRAVDYENSGRESLAVSKIKISHPSKQHNSLANYGIIHQKVDLE